MQIFVKKMEHSCACNRFIAYYYFTDGFMEKIAPTDQDVLGRILGCVTSHWFKSLDRLLTEEGFEFDHVRMIVLINVFHHPGLCQSCFTDMAGRDKASITRMIDEMETSGLLKRSPDEEDRRRKLLYLTDQGKDTTLRLMKIGKRLEKQALTGIKPDNVSICRDVLLKVYTNLNVKENGGMRCHVNNETVDEADR